jgi:hypothetical protein
MALDQTTTELNLLGGNMFVSHSLVYEGVIRRTNGSFPRLLTGSATSKFWSLVQPVMLMAPQDLSPEGPPADWDSGMLLASTESGRTMTVSAVGAASPCISGDGFEAYFFLSPPSVGNWRTPHFATYPGTVRALLSYQGTVIFPYSTSPYVVLQWDPAWSSPGCTSSFAAGPDFNLYMITPKADGHIWVKNIDSVGPLGTSSVPLPAADDFLTFNSTYSTSTDKLVAEVRDQANPAVYYDLSVQLDHYGFRPSYSIGSNYYFGFGGSGNGLTGYGLLYLSFTES